jgi:hypothetical protein
MRVVSYILFSIIVAVVGRFVLSRDSFIRLVRFSSPAPSLDVTTKGKRYQANKGRVTLNAHQPVKRRW